jgi:hypothetical protein
MRNFLLLVCLLTPLASAAPYPFAWGCASFEPSAIELNEIQESAISQLSPEAEYQEACFTEEPVIVGIAELEQVRTHRYRFFWPTGKEYRELKIIQEGRCVKAPLRGIRCGRVGAAVRSSPRELIYLYGVESAVELYDLLKFRDRFIGKDYILVDIEQDRVLHQDPTKIDKRIYRLTGISDEEGQISYGVERRCNAVGECTWTLSGPGQWRY